MLISDSANALGEKKKCSSILNWYMLSKEIGLNIEKYRGGRESKGTPSTTTQPLVTFCFCFFPFWCSLTVKWLLIHLFLIKIHFDT